METLKVLSELVKIRSDKYAKPAQGRFEYDVAKFLQSLLKKELPGFIIEEQEVEEGRINLFVHDGSPVKLLFIGHMDTVAEGSDWRFDPRGELDGKRFYGRGAADMKAGLVSNIEALIRAKETNKKGIAALFYCDEEYDFLGMIKFVEQYKDKIKPELVICPEPTDEKLRSASRGIIEFKAKVQGQSGHAARPESGISALDGLLGGVEELKKLVASKKNEVLGYPTLNVARVRCGAIQGKTEKGHPILGHMGNVIPDYCDAILEIRTVPEISYAEIMETFKEGVRNKKCFLQACDTTLNLGTFFTDRKDLEILENIQKEIFNKVEYQDAQESGYSDAQMLAEVWDVPTIIWGVKGKNMHGNDEYVEIDSVEKMCAAFRLIVDRWI